MSSIPPKKSTKKGKENLSLITFVLAITRSCYGEEYPNRGETKDEIPQLSRMWTSSNRYIAILATARYTESRSEKYNNDDTHNHSTRCRYCLHPLRLFFKLILAFIHKFFLEFFSSIISSKNFKNKKGDLSI